jgi:succinate-acetate transporter protein
MEVFNAWYYSFSPSVAGFIAGNDPLRAPVRVLLYPLLGILGVSSLAYSLLSGVPEFAIVVAGLAASSLIGLVYLTLPAMFGVRALLKRRRVRLVGVAKGSVALLTIALALLAVGEVTGSFLLLAIGGSATVLTCLIAAPAIFALAILHPNPE